jgi:hypothetical protein
MSLEELGYSQLESTISAFTWKDWEHHEKIVTTAGIAQPRFQLGTPEYKFRTLLRHQPAQYTYINKKMHNARLYNIFILVYS